MNVPEISIIIRTKNRPKQLANALKSIAGTKISNVEVIIVNDGGEDVKEVFSKMSKDGISYVYLPLKNSQGRSTAGNVGAEASSSPHIFFLDDDDLLAPDFGKLLERSRTLRSSGRNAVLYGKVEAFQCKPDGTRGKTYRVFGRGFDRLALLWENFIPFNAAIIPKELFVKVNGLDPNLEVFEDWDLFLKLSENWEFIYQPVLVCYYRLSQNSFILGGKRQLQKDCRIKILEKYWKNYTPQNLARIYDLFKLELRKEYLPEIGRLSAERKSWTAMDEKRKAFILNLEEQIRKKDHYINELATDINRKGNHIKTLEREIFRYREMDSDRVNFVRGLQDEIRHIKSLLAKN